MEALVDYKDDIERVEAKVDENYRRIEELIQHGHTRKQALAILSAEYDQLLEERFLFEQSLNFDIPQF